MTDIKLQYFKDYWRDLTNQKNSIEQQLVHTLLYNPKQLIKEFIYELEIKPKLSNKDNKMFFIKKINEFSKLNLEALNFIKPTLHIIAQQFSSKDDYNYLKHLLEMALKELSNYRLGKEAVIELTEIIVSEDEIEKEKIKHLINIIIYELQQKKYSNRTISQMSKKLFDGYRKVDKFILTDFPHGIKDMPDSEFIDYMNGLKLVDRLLALSNYFDKEPELLRYVFSLNGLRGDEANLTIGTVQIYNPKTLQLFKNHTEQMDEYFGKKDKQDCYHCNAAVSVETIDSEYATNEAISDLENILDIVACRYTRYKNPLTLDNQSKYYIINKKGENRGFSSGNNNPILKLQDSIEINNKEFVEIEKFYSRIIKPVDSKIIESMHWKRKAVEATENNEKILWHWVALENLIDNPKKLIEVVSKRYAKTLLYDFTWEHYNQLSLLTDRLNLISSDKIPVQLPTELHEELCIGKNNKVYLKTFVNKLSQIKENVDEGSLFYDQLEFLQGIFANSKESISLLQNFENLIYEKLVYIYRLRNKIVHNANNDKDPLINYYSDFIAKVTGIIVMEFIHKRNELNLKTNTEIINNILYDYEKFKIKLKEIGTKVLLVG